jgi:hypothetical protein
VIEVRVYECEPFQPEREFAVVTVDGADVQITGDDPFAQRIREIHIIDPDTAEEITAESDPQRWATLLPTAYRTPYMRATVTRHS